MIFTLNNQKRISDLPASVFCHTLNCNIAKFSCILLPQGPGDHQEDQAQVGEEVRFQYSDLMRAEVDTLIPIFNENLSFRLTSRETMKEKDLVASR